ncbi:MAG TPA: PilZ domain-containing protein [Verrucomicrobiae bacterium]|nr:PilZ domain-containing protein [Verrucomicrobiae bacterium]
MVERRQHERHAFSAMAEVVDMATGARLSTRAADLNKGGCYLDMLSPLPIGSKVRIRISSDGGDLACTAVVRDSQPGMGMGVAFTDLNDAQKALIDSWIERLGSPGLAGHSPSPLSENAKSVPPPDQRETLAVKLIDLLHKKGLLSSNDVAALLRDRIL